MNSKETVGNIEKANILIEALPYIQKYYNKTVVIKYGGNAMLNPDLKDAVMSDVVLLKLVGINVVLVHGGGPEINQMLKAVGKESRFVNGLRYTDEETMDIVQMVLCGKVNKDLVSLIAGRGGKAVGLCGMDGKLFSAKKLADDGFDYGYVGEVTDVNTESVNTVISQGFIPVVATVAKGDDYDGAYNINADTAAAKLAEKLKAEKLILLTDVIGLLSDKNDEDTLIPVLKPDDVASYRQKGIISGGMIPKIECCKEAVENGVKRAHIIDGRIKHSLLIEMLSDRGVGTMITRD